MSLAMICGADQTVNELLAAAIKEVTVNANWGWAIVKKTKAADPVQCGKQLTLSEKIKSTVSITDCGGVSLIAINVVELSCDCLNCGEELACNVSDLPFEQKVAKTLCYTSDGEWAWYLLNVTT
jgi:hypothetical protein